MMTEVDHDDDEVVTLLEKKESENKRWKNDGCIRTQFIAPKLFYFFFFSAQGSLMPYLALYYKQLRLSAAEAGVVSGAKMYAAFLIIPLWSMLVDKFKVGKLVFIMSSTALMATMLIISMAPANICMTRHDRTRRDGLANDVPVFNYSPSMYNVGDVNTEFGSRYLSEPEIEDQTLMLSSKTGSFGHTELFIFFLIVTICGTLFSCPCLSLADSATVDLLARNSETHKYGNQRLFGSIGNGLAAFIVGASISQTDLCPGEERKVNYYWCFYTFAVFMFLSIIAGSRLQFNSRTDSKQATTRVCASLRHVLVNANYLIFLFTVFFDGMAMSFIKAFLFWFLKDLGGTQFLFSVITAVNCSVEVLVYFFSSYLIQRLGSVRVLCIGLLCYTVRFSFYTCMVKPWLVLVVEPLSGITTAALWAAIMSHVGDTAAKDSAFTLQGVIHSLHWGLGHGSGSVLGGILVHNIGPRNTFALFAIISAMNFLIYILVIYCYRENKKQKQDEDLLQNDLKE
ncbi:major facilitator superfamily domain-containing protein 6-like [Dendronephthya gigantea]|uniref:major facilitator superfamily domain-containing protein 6-like n=1 Tax=Dendronephthya gigantea TaxID=151771 RepID=UPI0010695FFA|nr:major facilitator superfamily domain-containing protein 6-like [Dendronephthya gigantea]